MRVWPLVATVLGGALLQGFLSMGFQLVASRLLAPHFGTTIIVWAFLISTFLVAFSAGSFLGGAVSQLAWPRRRAAAAAISLAGIAGFAMVAFVGRTILRSLELAYADETIAIGVSCALLFLLPVAAMSALLPIYAEILSRVRSGAGLPSGLIYGTSTGGNVSGVMVTAFVLIPNFATTQLLVGWLLVSVGCFAAALAIMHSHNRWAGRLSQAAGTLVSA